VPKGTPAELKNRLNRELRDVLAQPDVRTAFETQGMTPAHSSAAELQTLMELDAVRWAKVVQAQAIKPD
jgi:tripartite-type tricarboxylate transporter receptor subunit TctC